MLLLVLEELVRHHKGIIIFFLYRLPHFVVRLCDGFRISKALDLLEDFLVYLGGLYFFDLVNQGDPAVDRGIWTNPRVILDLMNPDPLEGIDLQHPSNQITSHRVDAVRYCVISS